MASKKYVTQETATKKEVVQFINALGGSTAYDGKNKTLYIKGQSANTICKEVSNEFNGRFPFVIALFKTMILLLFAGCAQEPNQTEHQIIETPPPPVAVQKFRDTVFYKHVKDLKQTQETNTDYHYKYDWLNNKIRQRKYQRLTNTSLFFQITRMKK